MAVTSFDGRFSFKQDSLARLGDRASNNRPMSDQQRESFNQSPFMQGVRKTEELCWEFTCARDQKRAKLDPSFQPQDSDFDSPKVFQYEKAINYYKVLGIEEYATLEDVKKSYKKLSLIYHPDKSAGLSQEQKDEYAGIFIELKNAYQTLNDNPTRRQYDRDRDRDKASSELNGHKRKEKAHFNATEVLNNLMERARPAGKVINVLCAVKMEKFFYGGHKAIARNRKVQDKFDAWSSLLNTYRIDVPRGAQEPHECLFRGRGDHHEGTRPDSLNFQVMAKPHERVARAGNNLELKQHVFLGHDTHVEPYITVQTTSVNGRHILLWGRNPLYGSISRGSGKIQVRLKGEGFTPESFFSFTCSSSSTQPGRPSAESSAGSLAPRQEVLILRNLQTEGKIYMAVSSQATMGQIRASAASILQLGRSSGLRVLQKLPGNRGYTPYSDQQILGDLRELPVAGVTFDEVPFGSEQCMSFLQAVVKCIEGARFQAEWRRIHEAVNEDRLTYVAAQAKLGTLWEDDVSWLMTDFGFNPTLETLQQKIRLAVNETKRVNKTAFAQRLQEQINKHSTVEYRASRTVPASSSVNVAAGQAQKNPGIDLKSFLKRHGLAPPGGFERNGSPLEEERNGSPLEGDRTASSSSSSSPHGQGGLCDARSMKKRMQKQREQALLCELELSPISDAITLFTTPTCTITFFSNAQQSALTPRGQIKPRAVFAIVLCSPVCAKRKAHAKWSLLKERMLPVLQVTVFRLIQAARRILPRPLANCVAYSDDECEASRAESSSSETMPLPCKRLADEAFKRGEYYTAMSLYSRCLADVEDLATKSTSTSAEEDEAHAAGDLLATALSNRSACLAKVRHFQDSLADARSALERRPKWGKAWGRAGLAASFMGKAFEVQAMDCYTRAVEFDPSSINVDALSGLVVKVTAVSADSAHAEKEKGNQALRNNEVGLAVACYTMAIALLPKEEFARGTDGKLEPNPDEHALLRSVLHANRCGAFCRLKIWSLAVADGQKAVAAKDDYVQARNKLGIALLGAGLTEQAYSEFARGLSLEGQNKAALAGRQACLRLLPLWKSVAARKRHKSRFAMDLARPKGSTKVYTISDVFFDHKYNEDWAHSIDDFKFSEDVLIVAGNLCDTRNAIARALSTLKAKFRRVFYVPGNHEMWLSGEATKYPDTMAKLLAIFDLCDELNVDIFPAAICQGVFVVPLLSWYNAEFDEKDPYADFLDKTDQHCRWPIDKDNQVWKYMLKLNAVHLRHLYHGTVITFSHFLPRTSLIPAVYSGGKVRKTMGCEMIDEQARAVGSTLHIFGHTRRHVWGKEDGVTYANFYHGLEDEHEAFSPVLCVWDGHELRKQEVDIF